MKTLLQVSARIFSNQGQSSKLAEQFLSAWQKNYPNAEVIVRDLAQEPLPNLDGPCFLSLPIYSHGRLSSRLWSPTLTD